MQDITIDIIEFSDWVLEKVSNQVFIREARREGILNDIEYWLGFYK